MTSFLIAGNWKMNGGPAEAAALIHELEQKLNGDEEDPGRSPGGVRIVVFPPFISIPAVVEAVRETPIEVGAQDAWYEDHGAWTGEVSVPMIREAGCSWMIAGHSERREHFGESDSIVARKVKKGLEEGLQVILCVGETLEERKEGRQEEVVQRQLEEATTSLGSAELSRLTIAYEPVWAIGTGETATPEQAADMHLFIRNSMKELHKENLPERISVLYGGSMKPENAEALLRQPEVDGGLIGGASLQAGSFHSIIQIASGIKSGTNRSDGNA